MVGLWQRRAVRQMVYGLVPLLVLGIAMVVVLAVRFGQIAEPVNAATATTEARVVASQQGPNHDEITLRWTDNRSVRHTSQLRFPRSGSVDTGTRVQLRYDPDNPSTVYVAGDATSVRLGTVLNGIVLVLAVLLAAVVTTVVRIARRRSAERRPADKRHLAVSHSRRGLTTRTWITEEEDGHTWWQPVYWDPALDTLDPRKSYPVHGAPEHHNLRVVDVDGTPIWPAGRRRVRTPRGDVTQASTPDEERPSRISLRRHLRGDLALVFAAPPLGLLWAYIDESGAGGFWVSTAVLAGLLFWIPSVYASDPS